MNRRTLGKALALATLSVGIKIPGAIAQHQHGDSTPEAHDHGEGTPMVGMTSGTGAVFMTIENTGDTPDTLIAGSTDVAKIVEIHTMEMEGDVMVMMELEEGLEIPAGETVELKSGGYHVMLIDLTRSLDKDDEFALKLEFKEAGEVEINVHVGTEPDDDSSYEFDDLVITGVFSRPAPMLGRHDGTPEVMPEGTPDH
ncbi:MAG: copper chaperone PCu(A)C [Thermomicrobiales bacterium]|nr:copper chaperone PCu(A)C [Thermomicrobiales bacterium]MCO5217331.1 copper chaperone PCu(A)C [Thermomicrobiales bacterium]MCO5226179.1 copper chaperone PCu(A)C [Thermomicrobiales bacterium]MCO5228706.1 copper chaperone PCu(A)C [Thermomicrobiales bacterium]